MNKTIMVMVIMIGISFVSGSACAARLEITASVTDVIVDPENNKDKRILLYFDDNEFDVLKDTTVDFATLNITAAVNSDIVGTIEVLPLMTAWQTRNNLSWSDPWNKSGGDYGEHASGNRVSLKAASGNKELAVDISDIIRQWAGDTTPNNGLIIKLVDDDISTSDAEYSIDQTGIRIVIYYTRS